MISTEKKKQLCQSCKFRRNHFCTKHGDEWKRIIKQRDTCVGWGNEQKPKPVKLITEDREPTDKIRLGICIPNCSMGGVTRGFLTMMNSPVDHDIEWSGIAIGNAGAFDPETAKRILQHCPIYSTKDDPKFEGLVTIVDNACQTIIDKSNVVKLWGYIQSNPEIDSTDWDSKPMLVVAHGQCEWTRKNLAVSLSKGSKHIMASVSPGGVKCFPEDVQDRVKVVYNGVDFSRCAPARDRDEVRREWGIGEDIKAVGYVGRFAKDKNPLATAKAVAKLGEGYHAVYVGEGYQEGKVIEEVKRLCGDRVTFVSRMEDVGTAYSALDCMVLASPSEGGPQTVTEAWLAGCPVVATPVGTIPGLESEHGLLTFGVPHEPTRRELAEAVREAVKGGGRVGLARRLAWEKFSSGRMVKGYEGVLRDGLAVEAKKKDHNILRRWLLIFKPSNIKSRTHLLFKE